MVKMAMNDFNVPLTVEEEQELKAAESRQLIFDDDSPEMTAEMLAQFKRLNRETRAKKTISLRVSAKTLTAAKSYGKGYTGFLSRLLDEAIQDEEMVRKCL